MKMNDTQFNYFRSDFEIAMKHLKEKYGVEIELGRISYDNDSFTSKLSVDNKPEGGISVAQKNWEDNAPRYGFSKDDFGKSFIEGGKSYTITGWNSRSNKYKILMKSGDKNPRGTIGWVKNNLR